MLWRPQNFNVRGFFRKVKFFKFKPTWKWFEKHWERLWVDFNFWNLSNCKMNLALMHINKIGKWDKRKRVEES